MAEAQAHCGGGREQAAGSAGWLPLAELVGRVPVGERQLRHHCQRLRSLGQARKVGRSWRIAAIADIRNRSVLSWLTGRDDRPRRRRQLPATFGARPWDRSRLRDTLALLARVDRYMAEHAGESAAKRWAGVRRIGNWARARRLSVKPNTLRLYRLRVDPESPEYNGNLDRRGCARKPRGCSRAAWERFVEYLGDASVASVAQAWLRTKADASRHGWKWYSRLHAARSRARAELPASAIRVQSIAKRRTREGVSK